jgi:effector-binding domain-containing protein
MLRSSGLLIVVVCVVLAVLGTAYAADKGCAGCPKQGSGCACAQAKAGSAPQAPQTMPIAEGVCPGCGMKGGICQGCLGRERELLSKMTRSMCPNCTPDALCENCQKSVDAALSALPALTATTVVSEPIRMAYLAGTVSGDMKQLVMDAIAEAVKQNLFGQDTYVGCLYPDTMAKGFTADTPIYAGVNIGNETKVKAPLQVYDIPAGPFLKVDHRGSYDTMGITWLAAFAYADLHGLKFSEGPCGEVYANDPDETPVENLLTEIYLPLANEGAPVPVQPSVPSRPSA